MEKNTKHGWANHHHHK